MKGRRFSTIFLGVACAALLSSCLGVDMNTRFAKDGSGALTVKLRLSQQMLAMAQEQGKSAIPLTKEDVEASYKNLPGVKVESVTQENTDQDRIITAVISFRDFSVFKATDGLAGSGATLARSPDGTTTYRVIVGSPDASKGLQQGPSQATPSAQSPQPDPQTEQAVEAMLKSLMSGYSLVYSVTAPSKILSHTLGNLSADGMTVEYSIPMADYVDLKSPLTFAVTW